MYRTSVILRHTFFEAIVQPIYALLLALGAAILIIFGFLPFFTLGEDTVMFKSVGLDIILLLVLIATLFATSKSIYEEIEDRTMLTLMSKPVQKWEVLVGKYLGIVAAALLAVVILGTVFMICTWLRVPVDYQLKSRSLDEEAVKHLQDMRVMHVTGVFASLILVWFQVCVLAAIGVALSTRFSLVVNLPAVILLYIAGNMTRFLFPIVMRGDDTGTPLEDRPLIVKGIAYVISLLLPYLETFDDRQRTGDGRIAVAGTRFAEEVGAIPLGDIWRYAGMTAVSAACYAAFALAVGMWLFQTRELGGAEG